MDASQGGLNQQLVRPLPPIPALPARLAPGSQPGGDDRASAPDPGPLASFNGLGGFVGRAVVHHADFPLPVSRAQIVDQLPQCARDPALLVESWNDDGE